MASAFYALSGIWSLSRRNVSFWHPLAAGGAAKHSAAVRDRSFLTICYLTLA
jgi:hypothetical protein